jgi:hypothetical protein
LEILFYIPIARPFPRPIRSTHTVSPNCSRKSFFAKLAGLMAAVGVAPRLFAKPAADSSPALAAAKINLRPEGRAVPREAGSL